MANNTVRSPNNIDYRFLGAAAIIAILGIGYVLWQQRDPTVTVSVEEQADTSKVGETGSYDDFEEELGRRKAEEEKLRKLREANKPTVTDNAPKNETPQEKYERLEQKLQNVNIPKPVVEKPDPIKDAINAQYIAELIRAMQSVNSPIGYEPYANDISETDPNSHVSDAITVAPRTSPRIQPLIKTAPQPSVPPASSVVPSYTDTLANIDAQKTSITDQIAAIQQGDYSAFGQNNTPKLFSGSSGSSNGTLMPTPPDGMQTLSPASVLSATLESNVTSDAPSQFIARLDFDVWDITKTYKLLNRGDRVLGEAITINTPNPALNKMMGLIVKSIVRNDGLIVDMTDYQMLSEAGEGGVSGNTNYHILPQLLATVGYATTLGGAAYVLEDLVTDAINPETKNTLDDELVCTTNVTTTTQPVAITDPDTGEVTYENQDVVTKTENCGYKSSTGVIIGVGDIPNAISEGDRIVSGVEEIFVTELSDFLEPLFSRFIGLTPTINLNNGTKLKVIITEPIYITPVGTRYDEYTR